MRPSRVKQKIICKCNKEYIVQKDTIIANIKRNGEYLCHHCATIKAGSDGKYSGNQEIRSKKSKTLWENQEFRDKITITSIKANTTDIYKEKQSQRTKELWKNKKYQERVSKGVSEALSDISIRQKISESLHKKYLSDPNYRKAVGIAAKERFTNHEYRLKMAIIRANQPRISGIQLQLYSFLDDLKISYYRESDKTTIAYYVFDCLIPISNGGILIECQGNYWHSSSLTQSRDRAKFTYINKYFPEYEIMYIWEHEFSTKDRVLDRLKLKLGIELNIEDFEFSDIQLKEVIGKDVRSFLDQYHYIGGTRGGRAIAAYYKDKLIGCILFSKLLRQNHNYLPSGTVELSRLCIHPSYHKKNFASWFISKAIHLTKYSSIVSFADTTVGHDGTIYKASNFKFHHEIESDYWYCDREGYIMHKKTLYNKAINLKMTEKDFSEKYGYIKKWGGPKLCFVYQLS